MQVLAGPILRRMTPQRLTFWLMTTEPASVSLLLKQDTQTLLNLSEAQITDCQTQLKAGEHLYLQLLDITLEHALPMQQVIHYDLRLNGLDWTHWANDLVYPDHTLPFFILQPQVNRLLHGSCRKPHHPSKDGLLRVDDLLKETPPAEWPSLLMMSGDQIYADDVAAPMLWAIHQLIPHLDMPDEKLPCVEIESTKQLHQESSYYYARETLLPENDVNQSMLKQVFGGVRKPIFTTDTAHNHLISLAEMLAMYALVWSPKGWEMLLDENGWSIPSGLSDEQKTDFLKRQTILQSFVEGLPKVRRALAHLPVAMIFDDHDITDDWNLTAAWEEKAYNHPFSSRIIGNALLAYTLCQGWGNCPERFSDQLINDVQSVLNTPGESEHDDLLQSLFRFSNWSYTWKTTPPLVVLDIRTQRWRSEKSSENPSGLMDWEALTDLQQQLKGLDAVVLVSPSPIFGVKIIETIQRLFTWFGKPLMVDAENWMAHPGSAHTLMNMFRHQKTPKHFVILSGDVHYSFVYSIQLRGTQRGPDVWQITSSGIKNEFPKRLLDVFDRANRWLYSPRSPLNWFTRRRSMKVIPHKPETADHGERLLNASGVSLVTLNDDGSPYSVMQMCSDGRDITFIFSEEDATWE
ncbi:alkaline phosphatase family protein [Marinomonas sp. M1K-6]|uniref:Alkaline phosphatase family protein n=1 Tax=Marinomonas profundi TaxID=2726122 RepID=A0A847QZE6_9GAMM|nr:alkaline phosphatase D family protein [Marinomonas profundi]NLQ16371.1 alkaline phosphatase family protein [Marinomonas profundi]UDV03055.1 alkaline phosphatase D family protein [Marinomonas profundi]